MNEQFPERFFFANRADRLTTNGYLGVEQRHVETPLDGLRRQNRIAAHALLQEETRHVSRVGNDVGLAELDLEVRLITLLRFRVARVAHDDQREQSGFFAVEATHAAPFGPDVLGRLIRRCFHLDFASGEDVIQREEFVAVERRVGRGRGGG